MTAAVLVLPRNLSFFFRGLVVLVSLRGGEMELCSTKRRRRQQRARVVVCRYPRTDKLRA